MNEKIYCRIFSAKLSLKQAVKKVLFRLPKSNKSRFVDMQIDDFDENGCLIDINNKKGQVNGIPIDQGILKKDVFPVENYVVGNYLFKRFHKSYKRKANIKNEYCSGLEEASKLWDCFLHNSVIPTGYKHEGLSYGGYIEDYQKWCLPSWIWTNAAKIRLLCLTGQTEQALSAGKQILCYQYDEGGWLVRNDYGIDNIKPFIAPNDSAYIANNACLSIYKATGKKEYLDSAEKCAEWIINSSRPDGMVYFGYNTTANKWETDHNIVDVGFTAALFAELYKITQKDAYLTFLKSFTYSYIRLFYDGNKKRFWSGINAKDEPRGIGFARGQAWALEGLIPAYEVLGDDSIKTIIDHVVNTMLEQQNEDGSWSRELDQKYFGSDCKGTPVIAYSLYRWRKHNPEKSAQISNAVQNALLWCSKHTAKNGNGVGGIFSFSFEGAIVHHFMTSTALVYSSAYALELYSLLEGCI